MNAYYNENDPKAAVWLRELIRRGHIMDGEVDERSIEDVQSSDLRGFTRCHFFAGIGGWDHALNLAGWPPDRPVWTGSCPCQSFSLAGTQTGTNDARHLWPVWARLIEVAKPPVVFGEQVEAAIGLDWLDIVCADLERWGYACGPVVLPAACVGAPHARHRLWFVANSDDSKWRPVYGPGQDEHHGADSGWSQAHSLPGTRGQVRGMADSECRSAERHGLGVADVVANGPGSRLEDGVGNPDRPRQPSRDGQPGGVESRPRQPADSSEYGGIVGDPHGQRLQGGTDRGRSLPQGREAEERQGGLSSGSDFWTPCDWLPCRDGKARPVEPGTFPLAHGLPARVGRLRGYGNAIVPQVAAEVIGAFMDLER